jgi:hypothetical protein
MPRIQTLSHPSRRTWFEYEGSVTTGVQLLHKVKTRIPPRLFSEALKRFAGQSVAGGFSMTDPASDGFGAWVASHAKELAGRTLTPRHASFIAAILVHETHVRASRNGNAIVLHF